VEASEAIRRIFWRYRWLLIILVILPAAGMFVRQEHRPVAFSASASVQGQGTTPDADTQVTAIQSRVTAVATDPDIVQQAITAAGVGRNATQVAKHDVSVTPLGTSAVMVLTVTDRSRSVAIGLATALAKSVVLQLNQLGIKDNPELSSLNNSILQLTNKRNKLVTELDQANSSGTSSTSVQAQSLLAQLSATEQQLATNESTTQQILTTLSANTGASVVSTPTYASGVSRHAITYAALAGLLGLAIGLLFAALRELARPTVAQPASGARELGGVLLGNADISRGRLAGIDDDLAERLDLAAHRAGARTIVLTGPVPHHSLTMLAGRLNDELPSLPPEQSDGHGAWVPMPVSVETRAPAYSSAQGQGGDAGSNGDARHPAEAGLGRAAGIRGGQSTGWPLTVVALPDIRLAAQPPDAALVVALPEFAPHSALDRAADLGVTADWPILGVIGLRRRRWWQPARRPAPPRTRNAGNAGNAPNAANAGNGPGDYGASDDTTHMERHHD
jgi:hypothetical protein